MAFPSPSLTPPSLASQQMSFNGVKFSGIDATQTFSLVTLLGLDPPDYLSGDQQRALDQGEYAGIDLSPGRDIALTQIAKGATLLALEQARQSLGGAMSPAGNVEQPLYVKLASGLFAIMARPRKHHFPVDAQTIQALAATVNSVWHALDPRWYAAPTKTASVGLPAPLGGLAFNVTFPASFGGGGYGGALNVANNGPMEMRPILIITGPCTNPVVSNLTIPGAPSLGFNVTLNTGDTLTIDTDLRSVLLASAGSPASSSRRDLEMAGNTWWNLPGNTTSNIQWIAATSGVGALLTVQSADAYMSL